MRTRPPSYPASLRPLYDQNSLTVPQLLDDLCRTHPPQPLVPAKAMIDPRSAKFYISLYQPNKYKGGDIVSGTVQLASEQVRGQDIRVGSISIMFSGRCTTTRPSRGSPTLRRTVRLFTEKQILFAGPAKLYAPGRSERGGVCPTFPFHFTLPSDCSQAEIEEFEGGTFFNQSPNQPLPASFADENQLDKASVVYELKLELLAPVYKGYYTHGSFFQNLPLNVYTPRIVQEPHVKFTHYSKSFSHQSLDLLPLAERKFHRRPLTLKQRLGLGSVVQDRLPKTTFTATVLIPSVAILGQELSLMLHIDHDAEKSSVASPPPVRLRKLQLFLRIETSICGMEHRSLKRKHDETGWTTNLQVAGMDFVGRGPRVERLDLRKVMDLILDPDLYPTFKTFNIARTYSLRVAGTIECAGRSFAIWSATYARCIFLAKDYEPALLGYDLPPPFSVNEDHDHDSSAELPPYGMTVRNSQLVALPQYLSPRQSIALDSARQYRSNRSSIAV